MKLLNDGKYEIFKIRFIYNFILLLFLTDDCSNKLSSKGKFIFSIWKKDFTKILYNKTYFFKIKTH